MKKIFGKKQNRNYEIIVNTKEGDVFQVITSRDDYKEIEHLRRNSEHYEIGKNGMICWGY